MPAQIPASSDEVLPLAVTAPPGIDPTAHTPSVALMPAGVNAEPAEADWHPMTWADGKVALHLGTLYGTFMPPAGEYIAWVRIDTGSQRPVMAAGRVRIGQP